MKKLIIIKYAELTTKKDNTNYFIKILKNNIRRKLINDNVKIISDRSRMFVIPEYDNFDEVINKIKKIFGIHIITIGYELPSTDLDAINSSVFELLNDKTFSTFKVETKRSNKDYPILSPEVSRLIGGFVLKKIDNIKVDLHNPSLTIYIEIRRDFTYIYFEEIEGAKGLPVGTSSKGLLMLSGGIDSPVAGYFALKRGVSLDAIYFESPPHTSIKAKEKVIKLRDIISEYGNDIKLHVINLTEIQEAIYKNIPHDYLVIILRRMMYRISEKIANKYRCYMLINGESIGQVASQTVSSLRVINEVVKIPVIRPLACFDKLETIDLSRKINTYETSILPFEDCCTIFLPEHPAIKPQLKKCIEYEKLIEYEKMIDKCIKNHEIIRLEPKKLSSLL